MELEIFDVGKSSDIFRSGVEAKMIDRERVFARTLSSTFLNILEACTFSCPQSRI